MQKPVIDNITLQRDFRAPIDHFRADGGPFELKGLVYSPKFFQGAVKCYEAQLRNLRILMYPDSIIVSNSLHKFFHGNNFSDFHSKEVKQAFEKLSCETGIDWDQAIIKKMEYGINIKANPDQIISSLMSYKGKEYLPMHKKGNKYGKVCEFEDYKIKGYNKTYEVKRSNKIDLEFPLFRWEISFSRIRIIEKKIQTKLIVSNLLKIRTLEFLANDAITKFQNTIKTETLNLQKLTTHEKRVIAEMLIPEIKEDLKHHNKETYRRDIKIYRRIMLDKSICLDHNIPELIKQKFAELIEGNGRPELDDNEKQLFKLVV